ncbi:hypothetical protein VPH35_088957 [Triticum aestivum]
MDMASTPANIQANTHLVRMYASSATFNKSLFLSDQRGQAWRSGEVLPTCAKRSWVRTSLSALHFAGVRLGSYNPSPDPTLCGSFYALGLSFFCLTKSFGLY